MNIFWGCINLWIDILFIGCNCTYIMLHKGFIWIMSISSVNHIHYIWSTLTPNAENKDIKRRIYKHRHKWIQTHIQSRFRIIWNRYYSRYVSYWMPPSLYLSSEACTGYYGRYVSYWMPPSLYLIKEKAKKTTGAIAPSASELRRPLSFIPFSLFKSFLFLKIFPHKMSNNIFFLLWFYVQGRFRSFP